MSNQDGNKKNTLYEQQEDKLLSQSIEFLQMLTKRGYLEDKQIDDTKIRKADKAKKQKMYHNTMLMLQNYRNITWVLESFPAHIAEELDAPMKDLDALLNLVSTEISFDNIKLENRLKSIHKSRLLMDRFNEALSILRQKPGNGEMMYSILFQTYIIPEKLTHQELIYRLNISTGHYYRLRTQAINILAIRLWAAPTSELDSWLEVLTLLETI